MATKAKNGPILQRILDPVSSALNDEAARKLIGLKADCKVQARIAMLARKCDQGELTTAERLEYEIYVLAGEFVAILHAKAHLRLTRQNYTGRPSGHGSRTAPHST